MEGGGKKSKQSDWNDSEELTAGYFSPEKSDLSTHQLGHVWLTVISGYPTGICLPGTVRERQQEMLLKTWFFSYRTPKNYIQKIRKRNDIEKTCLHLEIRCLISIRQCFFHMPEWQEEFGATARCWISSPALFCLAKQWSTWAAEIQTPSALLLLFLTRSDPLPFLEKKSRTPDPGVPAPSLGSLGRAPFSLCKRLGPSQYRTQNPGTVSRAAALSCHSL